MLSAAAPSLHPRPWRFFDQSVRASGLQIVRATAASPTSTTPTGLRSAKGGTPVCAETAHVPDRIRALARLSRTRLRRSENRDDGAGARSRSPKNDPAHAASVGSSRLFPIHERAGVRQAHAAGGRTAPLARPWPGAAVRHSGPRMATNEKSALSAADFCFDPTVSGEAASTPTNACAVSAHSKALPPPAEMLVIERKGDLPGLLDPAGWGSPIARRKVA